MECRRNFETDAEGCGGSEYRKIREMEHIGVSNACLRLKMSSQNTAKFLFESEEGVGSSVTVQIPAEKLRKIERSGRKRSKYDDAKKEEGAMVRVLLVDDEPFIVQGLKVMLEGQSVNCEVVGEASMGKKHWNFEAKGSGSCFCGYQNACNDWSGTVGNDKN